MKYTIQSGTFKAVADSFGAELISVKKDGVERLWQNENGSWGGHAPVLFPVCGNCLMTVLGKDYPIKKHGFARDREFCLTQKSENSMTFQLSSDAETLSVYPYAFILQVKYEVKDNHLFITHEVQNPTKKEIYFSLGGHEAFALKDKVENYFVRFSKGEKLMARENNQAGKLTGKIRGIWESEVPLKEEYFEDGNTLIFSDLSLKSATLCKNSGEILVESKFEGFSNLLLWKSKDGKMICIEPWLNVPDTEGEHKEYSEKSGVLCVKPFEKKSLKREIIFY